MGCSTGVPNVARRGGAVDGLAWTAKGRIAAGGGLCSNGSAKTSQPAVKQAESIKKCRQALFPDHFMTCLNCPDSQAPRWRRRPGTAANGTIGIALPLLSDRHTWFHQYYRQKAPKLGVTWVTRRSLATSNRWTLRVQMWLTGNLRGPTLWPEPKTLRRRNP